MTEPRKPSLILPVAVVLLVGYAGAYYAMATPHVWLSGAHPFYGEWIPTQHALTRMAFHEWIEPVFAPIHWLDRRIRPHVWKPKP